MSSVIILLPLLGGAIGWLTNRFAIRLLFRPHQPRSIPLLGWKLQGLLPKRRLELARTVGAAVEQELLSTGDLVRYLDRPEMRQEVLGNLVLAAGERLEHRVPALVPRQVKAFLSTYMEDFIRREAGAVFDRVLIGVENRLEEDLAIGSIVEEKLLEIDLRDLEKLILQVAGRELLHIEVLGGVLGFLIGLVQAGLVLLLP